MPVEEIGTVADRGQERSSDQRPAVIITGPPWPRSGTGRVIQSQIEYYHERGFYTVLICAPVHCSFTADHVDWPRLREELRELGADKTFIAPIDPRRFAIDKYTTWIAHGLRGTALDWIVFTARSAHLSADEIGFIKQLNVAAVHVNHVFTVDFARRLLKETVRGGARIPIVLDTHDIQARALKERGEINPWTHKFDSMDRMLRSEIAHLKKAQILVHVSTEDLVYFRGQLPDKSHVLALPTIDERFVLGIEADHALPMPPTDILFVGQSTAPNVAAIRWFLEEVWPLIAQKNYTLRIVGGIETQFRADLPALYERFRHQFIGPVVALEPEYRAARTVIAPMMSGTGISIKTIEALASGKPFVGTSKAYRGMPMDELERLGLRPYDTPQSFADAIEEALWDAPKAARASRSAYAQLFSKQACFAARDHALELGSPRQTLSTASSQAS